MNFHWGRIFYFTLERHSSSILKLLSVVAGQVKIVAMQSLSGRFFAQMKFPWEAHVDSEIQFSRLGHAGLGRLLPGVAPEGFFTCKETDQKFR